MNLKNLENGTKVGHVDIRSCDSV